MQSTTLQIDNDLQGMLRDLSEEELQVLEANIVADGKAFDPIVTWQGLIVDGHHRYAVCSKHGLGYTTVSLPDSWGKSQVKDWIVEHQSGRRNLSPQEVAYYRGKTFNEQKSYGANIASKLATESGVSERTVRNDGDFARNMDKLDDFVRETILSGDAPVSREEVAGLTKATPATQRRAVKQSSVKKALDPLSDTAAPYRRSVLDLQRIKRFVAETCDDPRAGRYLATKQTRLERCLQEALDCLSQCEPLETCDCEGAGCNSCYGTGFLNRAAVQSRES